MVPRQKTQTPSQGGQRKRKGPPKSDAKRFEGTEGGEKDRKPYLGVKSSTVGSQKPSPRERVQERQRRKEKQYKKVESMGGI